MKEPKEAIKRMGSINFLIELLFELLKWLIVSKCQLVSRTNHRAIERLEREREWVSSVYAITMSDFHDFGLT